MERENNKFKFTLIWSSCICVLLLMVVLGVSSSAKGTLAAGTYQIYSCDDGNLSGNKCYKTFSGLDLKAVADGQSCSSLWSGSAGTCSVQPISTGGKYSWSCSCSKDAIGTSKTCNGTLTNIAKDDRYYTCKSLEEGASYKYCCSLGSSDDSDDGNQTEGDNDGNQIEDGECVGADCDNNETEDGNCNAKTCSAGQYIHVDVANNCSKCTTCPVGYWCPGGPNASKNACTNGKTTLGTGKSSVTDCVELAKTCNAGQYIKDGICTTCPADSWCPGGLNATRNDCPKDKISPSGSDSVTDCKSHYTVNFYVYGVVSDTFICESKDIDDTKTCTKKTLHAGETWYVDKECTTSRVVQDYVTGDTNYYRCKSAPATSPDDDKKEPTSPSNSSSSSSSGGSSSSEPSVSDPSDEEISSKPDDDNVSSNPQTGDIAIFVVWVIAAAAIVYSVWYFKQVREN